MEIGLTLCQLHKWCLSNANLRCWSHDTESMLSPTINTHPIAQATTTAAASTTDFCNCKCLSLYSFLATYSELTCSSMYMHSLSSFKPTDITVMEPRPVDMWCLPAAASVRKSLKQFLNIFWVKSVMQRFPLFTKEQYYAGWISKFNFPRSKDD